MAKLEPGGSVDAEGVIVAQRKNTCGSEGVLGASGSIGLQGTE